jgi:hypothetical protein
MRHATCFQRQPSPAAVFISRGNTGLSSPSSFHPTKGGSAMKIKTSVKGAGRLRVPGG